MMIMGTNIPDEEAQDDLTISRQHMTIIADVVLNALFLTIFLLGLWLMWTGVHLLGSGLRWTSLVAPSLFMLAGAVPLTWLAWVFYHNLLEGEIVIGSDRLRTMRRGRVLREVAFDGGTWAEVYFREGRPDGGLDDVMVLKFSRGWWYTIPVSVDEYSLEDLRRMLPLVRAAVTKRGLRPGKKLKRLMEIEEG